jgi:hypothetical protein
LKVNTRLGQCGDAHAIQPDEGYLEDTREQLLANIKQAGIEDGVVPMIMNSEAAARGWDKPIRLLISPFAYCGSTAIIGCNDVAKVYPVHPSDPWHPSGAGKTDI